MPFFVVAVVTDPLADVLNFIRDYNAKYPNHPVFYQGTYAQVLNDAKHELKFLAIYLHSESSNETANFCRNTLADADVIEYVNSNMLFWSCDISSPEGYRVSHSIGTRSYPAVVIVGVREHKMVCIRSSIIAMCVNSNKAHVITILILSGDYGTHGRVLCSS